MAKKVKKTNKKKKVAAKTSPKKKAVVKAKLKRKAAAGAKPKTTPKQKKKTAPKKSAGAAKSRSAAAYAKKAMKAKKAAEAAKKKAAEKKAASEKKAMKAKKAASEKKAMEAKKAAEAAKKKAAEKKAASAKKAMEAKKAAEAAKKAEPELKSSPVSKVTEKPSTEKVSVTSSGKKVRVLSVDDEDVIRALLEKVLTKAGYEVELADSGEAGLKIMQKAKFDLCVIDLKMPGMGGMAFLGKMKELYPATEAVILTGFGDIETAVDAMKKGAFNFVPKPFKKDTFLTIIERALERKIMAKEIEETRKAMREAESEAAKKIGQLESHLAAVEEAKHELGEQFNEIRDSLVSGTGDREELEKKVMALEKVAGEIKEMEAKLVDSEKEKKAALEKAREAEDKLSADVSGQIARGNKLDEVKESLGELKNEVSEKEKKKETEEEKETEISLGDIHKALSDFRKEIEGA